MTRDRAGGARALGIDGTVELRALFDRKMRRDHARFHDRVRPDIDVLRGHMSFELSLDRDGARADLGVDARMPGRHQPMTRQIYRAFERALDRHVLLRRQLTFDYQS